MGYKTKFVCEWIGFLVDDLSFLWQKCREILIPLWLAQLVITGSTAVVTIAIWFFDDKSEEKLALGFWIITWIFFVNLACLFVYWLATGAKRAHRRLR